MAIAPPAIHGPARYIVPIDTQSLAAQASYTSPTWQAESFRRINVRIRASVIGGIRMTFNPGFAGGTGRTAGTRIAATAFSDTTNMYTLFNASNPEEGIISFEFDPRIVTGAPRGGFAHAMMYDTATGLVTNANDFGFLNTDKTTAITGFGLEFYTSNFTGLIEVEGISA